VGEAKTESRDEYPLDKRFYAHHITQSAPRDRFSASIFKAKVNVIILYCLQ